jgi:hypothetical protein
MIINKNYLDCSLRACETFNNIDYETTKIDLFYADEDIGIDFNQLYHANLETFAHDIFGIANNINRETYPPKLINGFVPRCRPVKKHQH